MKIRKMMAALGACSMFGCCVLIYLMLNDDKFFSQEKQGLKIEDDTWVHIEDRLRKLEKDFEKHQQVQDIPRHQDDDTLAKSNNFIDETDAHCTLSSLDKVPRVDTQMLNLYRKLEFDNADGGVWKQGYDISYDEKQWHPNRKLKVFVVPHSHNDPGWLRTFEEYYNYATRNILNNMLKKLNEDKRRKFIWAEVSFFKLWWDEQPPENRALTKRLIHDGQLELVAGGWVMPDESVSHWTAQLMQLTEGHQWLKANLDYTPTCSWSIDPFGLSPTMPYLLGGAGLRNLVIQRVHYAVKKKLAQAKKLEFRWRQLWDDDGATELFTHMMPFYSYDVPHTCGPNPKICCQFDFFRLPKFGPTCPWRIAPEPIGGANVANRSQLLLDQYRKKAQLYKTNALLVPLGDDFRYYQSSEWDEQYQNYQKLFDHMNAAADMNVKIQFGTLSDYFEAVRAQSAVADFPSLSGDFFTYADRDDHYWSGYYTSRPFHKRLDRVLMGAIRGAEILASIAWIRGHPQLAEGSLSSRLREARQWHSLFQHHDGVTGTSKDHVVVDYAKKMVQALNGSAHVLQQSAMRLLQASHSPMAEPETLYLELDEKRSHHTSAGEKYILSIEETQPRKIVLYNPLPRRRSRVQTFLVSSPFVRVTSQLGRPVECQISPVWDHSASVSSEKFELSFVANVPALGLTTYVVYALPGTVLPKEVRAAKVTLYNTAIAPPPSSVFHFEVFEGIEEFSISQRAGLSASFGKSGLLKAIRVDDKTVAVHLEFVKYGTTQKPDRSGAYLFLPDKKDPDPLPADDLVVHLVQGPVVSKVFVDLPYVRHTCVLHNSTGNDGLGLHIVNEVDISETENFELAMRLDTDIESKNEFFTDLNGLNMIRRQRFAKIPVQANYYPMAAAAFIQDVGVRMTVLTAQPLGVTSMSSGQLEIMQDRRLMQDDNRGLAQGVRDNLLTNHVFSLAMERRLPQCKQDSNPKHPAGLLSVAGHLASEELLHPIAALHPRANVAAFEMLPNFSLPQVNLPSDINLVSLRVFPIPEGVAKGVGVVLHRSMLDLCWGDERSTFHLSKNGHVNLRDFLADKKDSWIVNDAPLTFHSVGASRKSSTVTLCPHDIKSVLIHKPEF